MGLSQLATFPWERESKSGLVLKQGVDSPSTKHPVQFHNKIYKVSRDWIELLQDPGSMSQFDANEHSTEYFLANFRMGRTLGVGSFGKVTYLLIKKLKSSVQMHNLCYGSVCRDTHFHADNDDALSAT